MTEPTFTVGTDVEFFLSHGNAGWVPATSFNCAGTRLAPVSVEGQGTYHRDNISVELQPLPAASPSEFIHNNLALYYTLAGQFRTMDLVLAATPAVQFDRDRLEGIEEATEIGCLPDKCAYTMEQAPPTSAETMGTWRTGSGHIHVGGIEDLPEVQRAQVVQWLDVLEGLQGRFIESRADRSSYRRRRFYGQAGRYRLKPYGVEWRTPSNLMWYDWVLNERAPALFASIYTAITLVRQGITVESVAVGESIKRIRSAIDGDDSRRVTPRIHYWQECLYDHPSIKSVIKEARSRYGCRASLFAA